MTPHVLRCVRCDTAVAGDDARNDERGHFLLAQTTSE